MSQLSAIIDELLARGASAELIAAAVKAAESARDAAEADTARRKEAEAERRLEMQRERTRKSRALKMSRTVTERNVTDSDDTLRAVTNVTKVPPKESSPTPPKEITPSNLASLGERLSREPAHDPDFLKFIAAYPKRIEKKEAAKRFAAAVKSGAAPSDIIRGAERYSDQVRGVDPQYVKSPVVWINRGCWDDETLPPVRAGPPPINGHGRPERRNLSFAALELENHERSRFEQQHDSGSDAGGPVETGGRSSPRSEDGGGSILSLAAYGRHS